jgi:hypothetical protein
MLYVIKVGRGKTTSKIECKDGVVSRATPSFRWAIGKRTDTVLKWAGGKGMSIAAYDCLDFEGSPTLGDLPTDSEIARKVVP